MTIRRLNKDITLRQIEPDYYQTYLDMIESSEDSHKWPWIANATLEILSGYISGKDYSFIELNEVPVGAFIFHGRGYLNTIGIGYWIHSGYRRQGIMEQVLKILFSTRIPFNALVHEDNVASMALCRKLGMTFREKKDHQNVYTINERS